VKMSGCPQHAWACFTPPTPRRAATTSSFVRLDGDEDVGRNHRALLCTVLRESVYLRLFTFVCVLGLFALSSADAVRPIPAHGSTGVVTTSVFATSAGGRPSASASAMALSVRACERAHSVLLPRRARDSGPPLACRPSFSMIAKPEAGSEPRRGGSRELQVDAIDALSTDEGFRSPGATPSAPFGVQGAFAPGRDFDSAAPLGPRPGSARPCIA
jgi:hypothetical protein